MDSCRSAGQQKGILGGKEWDLFQSDTKDDLLLLGIIYFRGKSETRTLLNDLEDENTQTLAQQLICFTLTVSE